MKKLILTLNFIFFSLLMFAQTKTYEAPNGKILTEEEYHQAKASSAENAKQNLGADYELYETLEIQEENKNGIKYKFKWEFLNEEMRLEKAKTEKLIGQTLDFEALNFLKPEEKNKINKNNPTFINFWFTNCPPCIEELPALNELKEKYKDKVNFIAITFDPKEKVEKSLERFQFDFIHIVGEKEFTDALGISYYPRTFLLDNKGVIKEITGSLPSKKEPTYKIQMERMEKAIGEL